MGNERTGTIGKVKAGMQKHKTAAIVLNYINYSDTIKCIDNLMDKGAQAEVIIVDNNSPNDSVKILEQYVSDKPNCVLIANKVNSGYAAGNNVGIRYAADNMPWVEYICIMNPDTLIVSKSVFDVLIRAIETQKEYAVAAPVIEQHGVVDLRRTCWKLPSGWKLCLQQTRIFHPALHYDFSKSNGEIAEVDVVHGSFFMAKMNVLKEIGFLDENTFLYCEETLLGLELKKRGYKEIEVFSEHVLHNHPPAVKRRVRYVERMKKAMNGNIKSNIYICKKYYSPVYMPLMYLCTGFQMLYLSVLHLGHIIRWNLNKGKK